MKAGWVSENSLYHFIPEWMPRPVAFGTYKSDPNTHFLLLEFVDLVDSEIPSSKSYVAPMAALHLRSRGKSPKGKFGFGVKTFCGTLPQSVFNDWEESWEAWWTKHMRSVMEREKKVLGPHSPDDTKVVQTFMDIVLPRYLHPLESDGRSVEPCLLHTDLWPSNVKYRQDDGRPIIFDSMALWGHVECTWLTKVLGRGLYEC
jgi:fructosamine-3-kinase